MIEETGRVAAIDGDTLWVETLPRTACDQCRLKSGCGQRLLHGGATARRTRLPVPRDEAQRLEVGDPVTVAIPEGALLRGALMVYLLPLLLFFSGVLLGHGVTWGAWELAPFSGALGLMAGFVVNRFFARRVATVVQLVEQTEQNESAPL